MSTSVIMLRAITVAGFFVLQSNALVTTRTMTDFKLAAFKTVSKCASMPSVMECLMDKVIIGMKSLTESSDPIEVVPGYITLIKYNSEDQLNERSIGQNNSSIVDAMISFIKTRSINLKAPVDTLESLKSAIIEARGKKDKYTGPLLMGAMMVAGTLLPIKLGALAMMSGKALMTSMLALTLAAILALKKLASGGGGGGHQGASYEVINVPSHPIHGHGRSLAHNLAYGMPIDVTALYSHN
ncbi:uncharacterized protein LOC126901446 [Daktulosphaira vitifoliae]|uniref:uncharacterized protein LOC126901446 n=1 Tax=Daktulosphaira vitifoliae TaxID=58002 RepID=UPI0021AAEA0E|nr:uncharacterized protein LOC126901446 [Daktulosphaira vitifoliae]